MKSKMLVMLWLLITATLFSQAPKWKVDLGEPIKTYEFVRDGKYLFFNSKEYAWLYNTSTGEKVWELEVDNYEKKGIHYLIGEQYIVGTDNALQSYDVMTGKLQWSKEYKKIDQDEYKGYEFAAGVCIIWYGDYEVAVDLKTGDELWRAEIDYYGKLVEIGGYNYSVSDQQGKYVAFEKGDRINVYDVRTGAKVLSLEDMEINQSLMKNKKQSSFKSDDGRYLLIALDDGAVLLDLKENRKLAQAEFKIDADYETFFPTKSGCAIFGKEKIVHFDFATGKTLEAPYAISDMRTLETFTVGDKSIIIISAKNKVSAIDITNGKVLWNTQPEDPKFEGFIHRYEKQVGEDALVTYVKASSGVTHVYATSLNLLTGKLNYQVEVGLAKVAISDFSRSFASVLGSVVNFLSSGSGNSLKKSFGYDKVGFNYETKEMNGNLLYFFRDRVSFANPETKEGPGEGIVAIQQTTGKIQYREYFDIQVSDSWKPSVIGVAAYAPDPLIVGDIAYITGNCRVIAFNLATGKKLWTVEKEIEDRYPTDIACIEGGVYIKYGLDPVTPTMEKSKVKLNSPWEMEPHGFAAIDAVTGKFLWKKDTEEDPGRYMPKFSIENYYNNAAKQLYFSDEEKVYALALRKDGGNFDWELNLDNSKIGEMPMKKVYAINETWVGSVPRTTTTTSTYGSVTYSYTTTTGGVNASGKNEFLEDAADAELTNTYTSWGNIWGVTARRCLRVLFDETSLLVYGTEGIGRIDVKSGKPMWVTEWDYDYEAVQYTPKIQNGNIVFCVDRMMTCINLENGKVNFKVKEAKKPRFFTSPDNKFIFSIDDEIIAGYEIK